MIKQAKLVLVLSVLALASALGLTMPQNHSGPVNLAQVRTDSKKTLHVNQFCPWCSCWVEQTHSAGAWFVEAVN